MNLKKPVIALLLGDASGVGPEVVAKYASALPEDAPCRLLLIGDDRVLDAGIKTAGVSLHYRVTKDAAHIDWETHSLWLLHLPHPKLESMVVGRLNLQCGLDSLQQIQCAVKLYQQGAIHGICYAPFNKAAMLDAGNPTASEMEYFAHLLGISSTIGEINTVDGVWTTRVTSHIPIRAVGQALTAESILDNILLAHQTIRQAGVEFPRIGVAALNPHGGEGGRCGREEIDVIAPAVEKGQSQGIEVSGPHSADILFMRAFKGDFDGVVTMYHDQGQIALKLKGFERSVTLGGGFPLPIGTCAHGTGFDIAGKGIASETSLRNAMDMVTRMAGGCA